ncbi:MAG: bifunctional diaminohydroxyphosphoribosylaminopyrimidine deaminase/5-amino-6-(5-phosphoribosylamino)uracil reductase RibD [Gammaproteobacteria bacterium]
MRNRVQLLNSKNQYANDREFMARAIRLAERGAYTTHPNPRVGCVIVKNNKILGEGWHIEAGKEHAEINALNDIENTDEIKGATVYVSLEPCCHQGKTGPCSTALVKAGVQKVIVAMLDPNLLMSGQGIQELKDNGIEVEVGVLQAQAEQLNPGYIKRMKTGRPFIRNKMAMSLDGRTALASGESKWITSEDARHDVHKYRARSDCIVTGVGTILTDDPSMTVRMDGILQQPLRVIIDTHLSTPLDAKILAQQGKTIILTCRNDDGDVKRFAKHGIEVINITQKGSNLDLDAVVDYLGSLDINEVLLEAGATLSGAMLQAGLVDELVVYMAPILLGNKAKGLFGLSNLESMNQKIKLNIIEQRAIGIDWRLRATVSVKETKD